MQMKGMVSVVKVVLVVAGLMLKDSADARGFAGTYYLEINHLDRVFGDDELLAWCERAPFYRVLITLLEHLQQRRRSHEWFPALRSASTTVWGVEDKQNVPLYS